MDYTTERLTRLHAHATAITQPNLLGSGKTADEKIIRFTINGHDNHINISKLGNDGWAISSGSIKDAEDQKSTFCVNFNALGQATQASKQSGIVSSVQDGAEMDRLAQQMEILIQKVDTTLFMSDPE